MSKKHIGIIAIVSVIFVCTASIGYIAYSGVWKDWVAGEWDNSYSYRVEIESTEEIYNITLYLPIPMKNGEITPLAYDVVNRFSEKNWASEIVDTLHGKMLKISSSIFTTGEYIVINQETNHMINTEKPETSEPIHYPRFNEQPYASESSHYPRFNETSYVSVSYADYNSYIYATYNSSENVKLKIFLNFGGVKSRAILAAYDIKGYHDIINCEVHGEIHGWHVVNGTLERRL